MYLNLRCIQQMKSKLLTVVITLILLSTLIMPLLMSEVRAGEIYSLTIETAVNGKVYNNGDTRVDGGTISGISLGTQYILSAEPDDGYAFYYWNNNGNYFDYANPLELTIDRTYNLQAIFTTAVNLTINQAVNGAVYDEAGNNRIDGTILPIAQGGGYSLQGVADEGYYLAYWLINGVQYSTENPGEFEAVEIIDNELYLNELGTNDNIIVQAVFAEPPVYILPGLEASAPRTSERLWSFNINDNLQCSPVISDGIAYLTSENGYVYAINITDVKPRLLDTEPIWVFNTGGDYITSSVAVSDGVVYVATYDSHVFALSAQTDNPNGELLWCYTALDDGFYATPTIEDGVIYLASCNGYILALSTNPNSEDGELLWSAPVQGTMEASPVISNGVLFVGTTSGYVYALDAQSEGTQLWCYETEYGSIYNSPAVSNGIVYVGSTDGYMYALLANSTNIDGELLWSYYIECDYNYQYFSTPTVDNGKVYFTTEDGYLYALEAIPNNINGHLLWYYLLDDTLYGEVTNQPIVVDGVIYANTFYGTTVAVNADFTWEGDFLLWQVSGQYNLYGSPTYADGILYLATYSGDIIAYASNSRIVFTQEGLDASTSWSVTFDGITQTSNANTITFVVCPNGEYSYTINQPNGYSSESELTGTIEVTGDDIEIPIQYQSSQQTYTVTVGSVTHGSITSSNGTSANSGDNLQFTITPSADYHIASITVDDTPVAVTNSAGQNYTFSSISASHTITATFAINIYTLIVETVEHGKVYYNDDTQIDGSTISEIESGAQYTLIAEPDDGYTFDCWFINGDWGGRNNPLELTIDQNQTVQAYFSQLVTLTIDQSLNGAVYDEEQNQIDGTSISIADGGYIFLEARPDDGYELSYWLINGERYSREEPGDFDIYGNMLDLDIVGRQTVQAVFAKSPVYILGGSAPRTNENLWSYSIDDHFQCSPVICDGIAYLTSESGYVYAINVTTVKPVWVYYAVDDYITSSVAVSDGVVYVATTNGCVYALSAQSDNPNGELLWYYIAEEEDTFYSTPTVENGVVYVSSAKGYVYALSAEPDSGDGELLWSIQLDDCIYGSIAISNNVIFVGTTYGSVYALDAQSEGAIIWLYEADGSFEASPTVSNGIVYIGSDYGFMYALLANSTNPDGECLWSYYTDDCIYSTATVDNGVVYFTTEDGYLYALKAITDNINGEFLWDYSIDDTLYSKPLVVDGVVYASSFDYGVIGALNANPEGATGEPLWYHISYSNVYGSPAYADGVLYVATNDGELIAFAFNSRIVFTETGLDPGTSWSVTFDGITQISKGNTITFVVCPNGEYSYTISLPDGYACVSELSGTIEVTGDDIEIPIQYQQSQQTYTVNVGSATHGSITSSNGTSADYGDNLKFTITPNAGYHITSITVDGTPITITNSAGQTYTFSALSVNHTITATFAINTYLITVTSDQGNPTSSTTINHGESLTASVTSPDVIDSTHRWVCIGYRIDDAETETGTSYTFTNITANHTITFLWTEQYLIEFTSNPTTGGTITQTQWMTQGNHIITATPNANYTLISWTITGLATIESNQTTTTLTVNGPAAVTANFEATNTIVAIKTTNNQTITITLGGNITAQQMSNMTITPYQANSTTIVAFTVTGPSGETGFGNITLPKNAIPYGSIPQVYIDGVLAQNQTYTQDSENFYIAYSTHFSTHEISIVFIAPQTGTTATSTFMGPMISDPAITPSVTPSPTTVPTPTPTSTTTPSPTQNPAVIPRESGLTEILGVIIATIALFALALGIVYRRKNQK